jgi:hypothetical protein
MIPGIAESGVLSVTYIAKGSPTTYERNQVIVRTPKTTGMASIILRSTKSLSLMFEPSILDTL